MNPSPIRRHRVIFIASISVCLGLFPAYIGMLMIGQKYFTSFDEHVGPLGIVPTTGRDVSYYDSVFNQAYEFTITETDFIEWAKSKDWRVAEITEMQRIYRPAFFIPQTGTKDVDFESDEFVAHISNGLFYKTPERHRGGFAVGFDRSTSRAYYHWNHH